jgi:arginase family enzyme
MASCPPGPHLEARVDALRDLRAVDFGDAPVIPADPEATHAAIEETVGQVVDAGALPVVLGGDHSITEPSLRAIARRHGPLGLLHFDAHADTAAEVFGVERSHGTPMYRLGPGQAYLSVDVDVLDPAFAPGTGTPEPGGLTSADLLWACREAASRLALAGADVVEVLPGALGSVDATALVAERIVRETLTGIALATG